MLTTFTVLLLLNLIVMLILIRRRSRVAGPPTETSESRRAIAQQSFSLLGFDPDVPSVPSFREILNHGDRDPHVLSESKEMDKHTCLIPGKNRWTLAHQECRNRGEMRTGVRTKYGEINWYVGMDFTPVDLECYINTHLNDDVEKAYFLQAYVRIISSYRRASIYSWALSEYVGLGDRIDTTFTPEMFNRYVRDKMGYDVSLESAEYAGEQLRSTLKFYCTNKEHNRNFAQLIERYRERRSAQRMLRCRRDGFTYPPSLVPGCPRCGATENQEEIPA